MHEIPTSYRAKLDRLIEVSRGRSDFAYYTVERLARDGSGSASQTQIRRLPDPESSDTLDGLDADDVIDRLIDDSDLARGGRIQITAQFWDADGDKIDPYKRQRRSVLLTPVGQEQATREAATRGGDHRMMDSAAAIMAQTGDRADGLAERLIEQQGANTGIVLTLMERRLADHLEHHAELMNLHRTNIDLAAENHRLRNEGIFVQLAKMDPVTQKVLVNSAMGALSIVVETAQQAWADHREDRRLEREIRLRELERGAPAAAPDPAAAPAKAQTAPVAELARGPETEAIGVWSVPCESCGAVAGALCRDSEGKTITDHVGEPEPHWLRQSAHNAIVFAGSQES